MTDEPKKRWGIERIVALVIGLLAIGGTAVAVIEGFASLKHRVAELEQDVAELRLKSGPIPTSRTRSCETFVNGMAEALKAGDQRTAAIFERQADRYECMRQVNTYVPTENRQR